MKQMQDVLIVGGGLNGPSLALALADAGLSVTVIDALPLRARQSKSFDGRSYALARASQKMLSALGIWTEVASEAQPILQVKASDGRAGEGPEAFFLNFDAAELEDGPMGYMLEDRFLRRALLAAMNAHPGVTTVAGKAVEAQSLQPGGATLTLSDGSTLQGRLIVGADGRASGTASRAGISRTGWGYGQTALVTAIQHELPHNGIAHQFFMPSGPLAILPLPDNRSSIVWSETDDQAAALMALPDDAYLTALRPRFGNFLGEISLAGARFTYPLGLTLANSFIADRVALVGDAAHGVHPIAGQGLNLGLRDVCTLAEVLVQASRRGEDIASPLVLARYQSWRRFDTASLAMATDGFNRLFSNDNPLLRLGRDLGMAAVSAVPAVRQRFMREAAGMTGDLPRLMQGKAL
jgi:2-octaprenyl-6-methoxyphenol hydroxylase